MTAEPKGIRGERGVVLLIVLIVVALLTIIVTEFTYTVQLYQHRTRNALNALQASLLARSAINIEESFLTMDKKDDEPDGIRDWYGDEWWIALREFCSGIELDPTMRIACALEDESGKLNVNLTRTSRQSQQQQGQENKTKDAFARDALRRIFEAQGIHVDLVDQLKEYWLQEPPVNQQGRQQNIPDFGSLEDFAAELGIATSKLRELRRILTAVPASKLPKVNVNTASGIVLAAIINDGNAVGQILERQQSDDPFKNAADLSTVLDTQGVADAAMVSSLFGVSSNLFRLRASALTNADPEGEQPGGIGQTLSELVWRQSSPCRADEQPPCWTLKPLDWQKEGGAPLLEHPRNESGEPGSDDENEDINQTAYGQ
jgi:type II secretory pathway component PulK